MTLAGLALRHRALVYLLTGSVVAAGVYALFVLPEGIYPEVAYPRIVVLARGAAFEPSEMIVTVTRPLEEAMSGTIGLRKVRSTTVRGGAELSLDFEPAADMQFALQQVESRLATVRGSLPPGVELSAQRLTPSVFPVIQYQLVGADPLVLRELADFEIRPRLVRVRGAGNVEVQGGDLRQVVARLDPQRLRNARLSVADVGAALRAADVLGAVGRTDRDYLQYSLIVAAATATPEAVGQVVVARRGERLVRVADLGEVGYGRADRFQLVAGDGLPAVLVNVSRQPGANLLALQQGIEAELADVRGLLPPGARLERVYDQPAFVRDALAGVRDAILIGGALAVAVLLAFLGRLRLTLIATVTLPLAAAGTLAVLLLSGGSLNLMSLGGLAVAIGLVIDDAVVVVENLERRLAHSPDRPPHETIREGTDEIVGPVVSSTLTTVIVFAPLGLLEGVVGQFFRSFSVALAAAVFLSLILALFLVPALASHWLRPAGEAHAPRWALRLDRVQGWYERGAGWLLDRPRHALGLAAVVGVAALAAARGMPSGFLPEMDEGGFILDYWAPTGASLAETDRQVGLIEAILRADSGVAVFSRRTGAELGFAATAPNRGDMTVLLVPRNRRPPVGEVMDRLRGRIEREVPGVRVEFVQLLQDVIGDLAGAPAPIELKLFSPDVRTAERAGARIAQAIEGIPGLVDLFDGVVGDNVETRARLDPVRVARLGLTPTEVEAQARAALFGEESGIAREPDRVVPIRIRFPDSLRFRPGALGDLAIVGPDGWARLSQLGEVRDSALTSQLLREDYRPVVKVTARVSGGNLGGVMARIRARLATLALPPGVRLELGGQYASQRDSFRQLLVVFVLATVSVLAVLVAQFRSFRGPVSLLAAAPLGLTGAVFALSATRVPFNVSSFMGLILLIGLVVKNGILLLDAARAASARGRGRREALLAAGRERMRPILMTTLCTLTALVPLALGLGAGAELQRPLAIAVIGGLILSTFVTLLLLPVLLLVTRALPAAAAGGPEPEEAVGPLHP